MACPRKEHLGDGLYGVLSGRVAFAVEVPEGMAGRKGLRVRSNLIRMLCR